MPPPFGYPAAGATAGGFGPRPGIAGPSVGRSPFGIPRPVAPSPRAPSPPPVVPPPVRPPPLYVTAPDAPSVPPAASWGDPSMPVDVGTVVDRRTGMSFDAAIDPALGPIADYGPDVDGTGWGDPTAWPDVDPTAIERLPTALDGWHDLLTGYLDTRNVGVSATGEAFPETTAGDVRRAALRLSRDLCLPRYDGANLVATRAAWRDAHGRVEALCARVPWGDTYPENERFWLSDSLALAQRLTAVDVCRNGLVEMDGGVLTLLGDRSDPLTTWQDLRAYFLARRPVTADRSWRYPETTVGDVGQIVRILDEDLRQTMALAPAGSGAASALRGRIGSWRDAVRQVHALARQQPRDATYPDNAGFWRAARKLAVWLSVGLDVAREDAERSTTLVDGVLTARNGRGRR